MREYRFRRVVFERHKHITNTMGIDMLTGDLFWFKHRKAMTHERILDVVWPSIANSTLDLSKREWLVTSWNDSLRLAIPASIWDRVVTNQTLKQLGS